MLRDGYELAIELGEPQAIFLTSVGLGWALDEAARHEEALEVARSARDHLRCHGRGGALRRAAGVEDGPRAV